MAEEFITNPEVRGSPDGSGDKDSAKTKPTFYKFLVTTIDVIIKGKVQDAEDEYGVDAEYVQFDGDIQARLDDDDTAFLLNVTSKEIPIDNDDDDDKPKTKFVQDGIKVSKSTFLQKLYDEQQRTNTKFLACVHGFQVEPHVWMSEIKKIQTSNPDAVPYTTIPVIWPSVGKAVGIIDLDRKYDKEQKIAAQAGVALAAMTESDGTSSTEDISISLLCHSMGNRVLLMFAQMAPEAKRFDHVFMVAADVWEEVFNERVITDTWCQPPWNYTNYFKDSGLRLCNMLKDNGKIHVVHYPKDIALLSSHYWENRRNRLGRHGTAAQDKLGRLDRRVEDKLVDVDLSNDTVEVLKQDTVLSHGYYGMPKLIDYYSSVLGGD
mmetsp:Transcript_10724/g.13560  ORF Transcript_10724/g.13560 Transcript_10724/m.13560 type:complete len:377 (+) Transcript_10724:140-1270(+)|eukprot:CAMPEP_0203646860 /NCGR_PEP_ID=MMETSP0088-20131115/14032_1 /ASSEMBLY_ACC=CAM_ASM_001087 /TAXON_ID=426623 /ORGANISM="Chaetoceros affinis, Strain CCMP159" /LENGTH=376 /DNA_ID=CAMNT_0050504257 /DNA_START=48 /DNA_END=1178 /DNA_ORIENTATION=+